METITLAPDLLQRHLMPLNLSEINRRKLECLTFWLVQIA